MKKCSLLLIVAFALFMVGCAHKAVVVKKADPVPSKKAITWPFMKSTSLGNLK